MRFGIQQRKTPGNIPGGLPVGNQSQSLELIICACASDTAVETGRCVREGTHEQRAAAPIESLKSGINGRFAKIVIKILGFGGPMRCEHPFETAADRPTNAGLGNAACGGGNTREDGGGAGALRGKSAAKAP